MSGRVGRELPNRVAEGEVLTELQRVTPYNEPHVKAFDMRQAADEGGYFTALNGTPGTGVAGHAAATTHDTAKPYIFVRNDSLSERVTLDYLKLRVTAAGTGGTLDYATHTVDRDRTYSSGGGNLTVSNVTQFGRGTALKTAKIGAVVPAQANTGNAAIVAHHALRAAVISVVGDLIVFNYGGTMTESSGLQEGTLELDKVYHCPPIVLGPGDSYHLVIWSASQSAAKSYECEMGFWQR